MTFSDNVTLDEWRAHAEPVWLDHWPDPAAAPPGVRALVRQRADGQTT